MKCAVCEYKHIHAEETENGLNFVSDGFESFIRIDGAIIETNFGIEKAGLFACPKCGTVKLSKFGE